MSWNCDDDVVRVPRSIPRVIAKPAKAISDMATEWPRVQVVLMKVLTLFPEARDAFLEAVHEAFESKREPIPQWAT